MTLKIGLKIYKDNTNFEQNAINNITFNLGLHQLTNDPTHILKGSFSCIESIFTPPMFLWSRVLSHYPPLCIIEVLHYREANIELNCGKVLFQT